MMRGMRLDGWDPRGVLASCCCQAGDTPQPSVIPVAKQKFEKSCHGGGIFIDCRYELTIHGGLQSNVMDEVCHFLVNYDECVPCIKVTAV